MHSCFDRLEMDFIPFGQWFRGSLKTTLDDYLLSSGACYRDYLSQDYVQSLVRRHHAGGADLGLQLWTLLCFEIWLRSLPRWLSEEHHALAASTA